MTKAQFGLHIWIGIFLCLFSVSCSDDDTDSIKGDDDDTDLSINHWIEKKLRNDYLWYNELPATNKIDYTADPETFFLFIAQSERWQNKEWKTPLLLFLHGEE
ncbi:hypothetical protein NXW94_01255 [Bacteroides ovatus]|nr:hypothetical protein [Bacteroides ovatus]